MTTEYDPQAGSQGKPAAVGPDQPVAAHPETPYAPTDEDRHAFEAFETELFKREVANAKAYDKAILLYSTGALGLSLTFIKDILPPGNAVHLGALDASWLAFLTALVGMLASYLVGQVAIRRQRDLAYEVFLKNQREKLQPRYNRWAAGVDYLNVFAGLCFVLGATCMTWFVASNVERMAAPPTAHSALPGAMSGKGVDETAVTGAQQPAIAKPRSPHPSRPIGEASTAVLLDANRL